MKNLLIPGILIVVSAFLLPFYIPQQTEQTERPPHVSGTFIGSVDNYHKKEIKSVPPWRK